MSNNSLIEVKDNIFTRIFKSIRSFFFKQKKDVSNAELAIENIQSNEYKEKIFKLYKMVKKRQIEPELIEIQDLEKIKILLEEELRIKKEKLEKKKFELQMCKNELKMLNG